MNLEIEKFLKSEPDWERKLAAPPYNLIIKRDGEYVLFKYNQFDSDMSQKICRECRGIIFHEPTLTPVCVPFFKFFNYGEPLAAEIDWKLPVLVTEKIDGSLMKLWYHAGRWHLSTNGNIDAYKAPVEDKDVTFGQLFEDALDATMDEFLSKANRYYTYMFELVHPESMLVVHYDGKGVFALSKRDMLSGDEVFGTEALPGTKPIIVHKRLHNLQDTIEMVNFMGPKHEGVVVQDKYGNRIKIKSPRYLLMAKAYNNGVITLRQVVEMYKNDTLDDYMAYAPKEHRDYADKILHAMRLHAIFQKRLFDAIPGKLNRRAFVGICKNLKADMPFQTAMLDGKFVKPMDYFKKYATVPYIIRLLEKSV